MGETDYSTRDPVRVVSRASRQKRSVAMCSLRPLVYFPAVLTQTMHTEAVLITTLLGQ